MKILIVNSVCGVGSTGRICTDIHKQLIKDGHQCTVAYSRQPVMNICEEDTFHIGSKTDVIVHGFLSRITDRHGLYSAGATRRFVNWIKEYSPDLIHLHNIHGYYINYKILFEFLKESGIPAVWTLHDCWPFTGHCSQFVGRNCDGWRTGCGHCMYKDSYPVTYGPSHSGENFKEKLSSFTSVDKMTIVTPSEWLAGYVRQSFLGRFPVRVVNNGIDLSSFKKNTGSVREKFNIGNKKIVLGVANVWSASKGLHDFKVLSEKLPDDYRIVLVGVDNNIKKEIPDKIITVEHTDSIEELAQLYSAAEVFVNPTHMDTYPTVNLEALACGTPVLTYDSGGSSESAFIEKDDRITDGDTDELLRRITERDYRNKVEDINNFSRESMAENYISLYREVAAV